MERQLIVSVALLFLAAGSLLGTNGMQMEGYGPISHAMGGTSVAFDNGNAAVINNPATLSLGDYSDGGRYDFALGFLGPDVASSSALGGKAQSQERAYFMPAFGWSNAFGKWVTGIGLFAQGGMGTDYGSDSFLALGSGDGVGAEVSFGRVLLPVSYRVNERLTIGGSIDFVRATMDLRMALPATEAFSLIDFARSSGNFPPLGPNDYIRIDFDDGSHYSGAARGYGLAAKIGFTYALSDTLTFGAVYNTETQLDDLEGNGATFSFGQIGASPLQSIPGEVQVFDFQWPKSISLGFAWKPNAQWLLTAEWGRLFWSETLEAFKMQFSTEGLSSYFSLPQNWGDQDILRFGAQYQMSPRLALRAGLNVADQPIPKALVNPLFPAIPEWHYTGGFSLSLSETVTLDVSLVYVPEKELTNGQGIRVTHGQTNAQAMISARF
jgi:long-chain fatty acid transport protein